MADETPDKEPKARSTLLINVLVSSVLGFVCGGLGFAFFTFVPGMSASSRAETPEVVEDIEPAFIPFGEVVVNLGDARMSRYLRLNITLQINSTDEESASKAVELHRAILRNWVIGHLSDLQMEDVRGTVGQNRIRREILNFFNEQLSEDGKDTVQDILFEEFTVQ